MSISTVLREDGSSSRDSLLASSSGNADRVASVAQEAMERDSTVGLGEDDGPLPPFVPRTREPTPTHPLSLTGQLLPEGQPFAQELNRLASTREVLDDSWYENRKFVQAAREFIGDANLLKCNDRWNLALRLYDEANREELEIKEQLHRYQILVKWQIAEGKLEKHARFFPSVTGQPMPENDWLAAEFNELAMSGKLSDEGWCENGNFVERAIEFVGSERLRRNDPKWDRIIRKWQLKWRLEWRLDVLDAEARKLEGFVPVKRKPVKKKPRQVSKIPFIVGAALGLTTLYIAKNPDLRYRLLDLGQNISARLRFAFWSLMQEIYLLPKTVSDVIHSSKKTPNLDSANNINIETGKKGLD
jgi:hypothetical protein